MSPTPSHQSHRPRALLRWLAYTLGGLLVLAALAWLLVMQTREERTVVRSDGRPVTVRWDTYRWWPQTLNYKAPWACPPFASIISITDAERTVRDWHAPKVPYETAVMVRDHRDGYCVATAPSYAPDRVSITTFWLGPHGQHVAGLPADFPLRRCVENVGTDSAVLQNFDPAQPSVRKSVTARLWWKMRTGEDVFEVPVDFIKEILDTEFGGERDLTKVK